MSDPDPITIAARALVRACADSSEEFEIDWHRPGVREAAMRCAMAAFAALKAEHFKVLGREPTEEMTDGLIEWDKWLWQHMWDAAPDYSTPPSPANDGER